MNKKVSKVLNDVILERDSQDKQWGGPVHDDTHEPEDWFFYIDHQIIKALDEGTHRERLVKIAALAVAAVESIDRKENGAQI